MTKTLDDLKKLGREEQSRQITEFGVPLSVFPDELAEKAWNLAIDTAIGNLPDDEEMTLETINNGYAYRTQALQTLLKMKV